MTTEVEIAVNEYTHALGRLASALKRANLLKDGDESTLEYAMKAAQAMSLMVQSAILDA